AAAQGPAKSQPRERLYVGNLHQTVDEYTLIQLFSRYGKVIKLDFLFHKSGPMKGKPRGYAFVEYADVEVASKALNACNGKLVRGRKISVTFANQAPDHDYSTRPRHHDTKTTTLSLLKTAHKPKGTQNKIAALEAKLRQMEREKELKEAPKDA
ncbi:RNA-binding domain-containing protein, partial [Serendipita vermifera]